jgi:hypothetical protein
MLDTPTCYVTPRRKKAAGIGNGVARGGKRDRDRELVGRIRKSWRSLAKGRRQMRSIPEIPLSLS